MDSVGHNLKTSFFAGVKTGISSFIWILKILIPISFLTAVLVYSGWLNHLDFLLKPVMATLSLPPTAALPLLVGMLAGPSAGIASTAALPLSTGQMTLIAIFLLISHALVQEGIIQSKSGLSIWQATLFRLAASILTVVVAARFMPSGQPIPETATQLTLIREPFTSMLEDPALFPSLGLSPFWLWVPRILAAIIAVHCLKLYQRIKSASGVATATPEPQKIKMPRHS
jgi:spore maturation protein SpmB